MIWSYYVLIYSKYLSFLYTDCVSYFIFSDWLLIIVFAVGTVDGFLDLGEIEVDLGRYSSNYREILFVF